MRCHNMGISPHEGSRDGIGIPHALNVLILSMLTHVVMEETYR